MKQTEASRSTPLRVRMMLLALHCVGHLPVGLLRALAWPVGTLCWLLPTQLRKVSEFNLRLCFPDLDAAARRSRMRRSLEEASKTALETTAIWLGSPARLDRLRDGIEGEELLERALAAGRGAVLLSPHLGNWEFLNCVLPRLGQVHSVYRIPRLAGMDGPIRRYRERSGIHMVPATSLGLRRLLRALEANQMVLILPDQEPGKEHGVHAPFFGVPALTMTLVSRILRRTGAVPLYVFAERRSSGRFRVHFRAAPAGLADSDPRRAAASLNAGLEECVRFLPDQYVWNYKRFKTAPSGEPTPYRAIWSKRQRKRNPFSAAR
jgi:KDO2-lipid IV(A) lauroyltransferase